MKIIIPFLFLLLFSYSLQAEEKNEITMGFSPAENASAMELKSKLLSDYFLKKAGIKVKSFIATDYTALIEAMRSGMVDFAWFPPYSFITAEKMADAKVLLKVSRRGHAALHSAIFTRADKNFKTIESLKGKNIAWVDQASFTGHIFPKAAVIQKVKGDIDNFFGRQLFAGSHDTVVLAVHNGTVDAGATWCNDLKATDCSWHLYLKNDSKKIHAIYVSPDLPSDTVSTTNKFLKERSGIVKKVTNLLVEMTKDEEGKKILFNLYGIDALLPATNKEFDPVRKAAHAIGLK